MLMHLVIPLERLHRELGLEHLVLLHYSVVVDRRVNIFHHLLNIIRFWWTEFLDLAWLKGDRRSWSWRFRFSKVHQFAHDRKLFFMANSFNVLAWRNQSANFAPALILHKFVFESQRIYLYALQLLFFY